ncbi:MAG: radical SAM protein [Candidatus Pacearchaeota archaeon]
MESLLSEGGSTKEVKEREFKESFVVSLLKKAIFTPILQTIFLNSLERRMYKDIVEKNPHCLRKVKLMKFNFARALLTCSVRNFKKGYISKEVANKLVHVFVQGNMVKGAKELRTIDKFRQDFGIWPPGFIVLSPTQRCNLRCVGCYASSKDTAPTLPFNVVERIANEAHDLLGNKFMVISGGEPLMYQSQGKTLFDIWEQHPDMFFMFYTNGTLINEEVAERLARLGNVSPAISLEGFEKETDVRRGKGVFKKILEATNNLRRAGVPFGISLTATRENIGTLLRDDFYDFIFLKLGATYIWLFQLMPIGKARTVKELMLTPEERVELLKKWEYLLEKKRYCIADFWNSGVLADGCIAYARRGGYFYIDWNGNIMPCVFVPYYEDNIIDLYKKGKSITDALFSDLFKNGRKWQEEYGFAHQSDPSNWLMPCSIRDHFKNFKKNILTKRAKPEDKDAALAIKSKEFEKFLDEFDKKLEKLTDPIWRHEYLKK